MTRAEANAARAAKDDMAGQRFGNVVVLSLAGRTKAQKRTWTCRCDCGREFVAAGGNLKSGRSRSCGCYRNAAQGKRIAERSLTHGQSNSPSYRSWAAMLTRCTNSNATGFHRYGGRGIAVCDRWRDFAAFLTDMGERPTGKSLDRWPNPDGNYEPGNCRWATPKEQAANKSTGKAPEDAVRATRTIGTRIK